MESSSADYRALSIDEELENWKVEAPDGTLHDVGIRSSSRYTPFVILFATFVIGLGAGIVSSTLAFSYAARSEWAQNPTENLATSPLWTDAIKNLSAVWTRFNGSLYAESKYRGPPSPELDAEWDRYTDHEWFPGTPLILGTTASEIHQSQNDFSLETKVQLDEENGGPGYMSSLEMFHHLHCLNVLRKWTHIEHYKAIDEYWAQSKKYHLREHTDHCIEMLRQVLMCQSDTGLVTFHWTNGTNTPSPYFSTAHKCRDPEQVLQWAHSIAKPIHRHIYKEGDERTLTEFPP